ncbi:MAG: hypothetical protein AB8B62_07295 [Roseobacter sp.]
MRRIFVAIFISVCLGHPLFAQDDDAGSFWERSTQQFLENLFQDMEPAWQDMQDFLEQMGPAMMGLMDEVKDWSMYETPEILENGDIIMRRKPQNSEKAVPIPMPEPMPQIEL